MKIFLFTCSLLIPFIFLTTCKKHVKGGNTVAPDTEQDYFDCKINGVQWSGPLTGLHLNYYCECDSTLSITAYRQGEGYNQELLLVTDEAVIGDTGNVIPGSPPNGGTLFGDYVDPNYCKGSFYYLYRNGKIFLQEHNIEKHYFKGTFWINGRSPNCSSDSIMEITDGKFLIHY